MGATLYADKIPASDIQMALSGGDDYELLKDAGFHFYFEVQDYKKAYQIYSKLKNHRNVSS